MSSAVTVSVVGLGVSVASRQLDSTWHAYALSLGHGDGLLEASHSPFFKQTVSVSVTCECETL
jgi:hypothetical protein